MPKFKVGDRVYITYGDRLGPTLREVIKVTPAPCETMYSWYKLKSIDNATLINGAREDRLIAEADKTRWEVATRLRK